MTTDRCPLTNGTQTSTGCPNASHPPHPCGGRSLGYVPVISDLVHWDTPLGKSCIGRPIPKPCNPHDLHNPRGPLGPAILIWPHILMTIAHLLHQAQATWHSNLNRLTPAHINHIVSCIFQSLQISQTAFLSNTLSQQNYTL